MYFRDRADAATELVRRLSHYANNPTVIVLGLARGGVPVAAEVAPALGALLDVFVVRKLRLPGYEEIGYGAIASGGYQVCDSSVVEQLRIPDEALEAIRDREFRELQRREQIYRGGLPPVSVNGRTVILVDDGILTGFSMRAAIVALRPHHPARVVVAVPVAPNVSLRKIEQEADEVICVDARGMFRAVEEF